MLVQQRHSILDHIELLSQLFVAGLAVGSVYALLALAMVLVYKASSFVNFAQGEMAMLATFIAYFLRVTVGLPAPLVLILTIVAGALIGVLTERIVIRPIANGPEINGIITSVGLLIVFRQSAGWIWGYDPYRVPSPFAAGTVQIGQLNISSDSIGILVASLVVMLMLYVFFGFTRLGVAMRAASLNRRAARLMGIDVEQTSLMAWGLASALGAVCGMLVAPIVFLDYEMMSSVLLKAFAGVVVGGFESAVGAVIGCILLGLGETFFGAYVSSSFKDAFALVAIVLFLMFKPTGLFGSRQVKKV